MKLSCGLATEVLGEETSISLSSEIGSVGLLERENATILNAAVVNVAKTTVDGFINALKNEGILAKVFFCQNDGTLMSMNIRLNTLFSLLLAVRLTL
jgi:N-methylhydantoinase A/oxoprolinase/acetone carboxylase beta subunit